MSQKPKLPNWSQWIPIPGVRLPSVQLWEACAMSLNIAPKSLEFSQYGWMGGSNNGMPSIEPESFPSEQAKDDFFLRLTVLMENLSNRDFFKPNTLSMEQPYLHRVALDEFAKFAMQCRWQIPSQMAVLAKQDEPPMKKGEVAIPSMIPMSVAMGHSGYSEEKLLELGCNGDIVFLVYVPDVCGACRVPSIALSHFMAGATEYRADKMPEHYNGTLSGPWTIKLDRLRILEDSWAEYSQLCKELVAPILEMFPEVSGELVSGPNSTHSRASVDVDSVDSPAAPKAPSVTRHSTKPKRRDLLTPVIELAQSKCRDKQDVAEVWGQLQVLAEAKEKPLIGATEEGLKYLTNGTVEFLSRDAFAKRLARQ